jgi:CRISPR system Cascade subunit CasC
MPKTVTIGGYQRQRISSQALKRAWRTSELFAGMPKGTITRTLSQHIQDELINKDVDKKTAKKAAEVARSSFIKGEKGTGEKSMLRLNPAEWEAVNDFIEQIASDGKVPDEVDLIRTPNAVDLAMFGRMLAGRQDLNTEAAVQVSHAFSVNRYAGDIDYFTAVDDLDPSGAGHIDERGLGASVYYSYVCVNRDTLTSNLGDDENLAKRAIRALVEAVATITPSGYRSQFGSYAYASYLMGENGDATPRSLATAFYKPIDRDILEKSIQELKNTRTRLEQMTTKKTDMAEINTLTGEGSMEKFLTFATENQ